MATVNLGAIKFNWKGAYNNSTQYQVDDVVSSGGSSYVCILASQGNAVSNGTYWSLMAEGGNISTTLTTQGIYFTEMAQVLLDLVLEQVVKFYKLVALVLIQVGEQYLLIM